jgi:predicted ATPase/DNA-binding SARP family transcriptional activator
VQFHDLGPLLIDIEGSSRPLPGLKLTTALAALLINANQRVPVDTLIEAIWGPAAHDGAASTLETHIWRLRRVLEPRRQRGAAPSILVNDTGGYRLVTPSETIDSLRFQHLADRSRDLADADDPEALLIECSEALSLWRGRPYEFFVDHAWAAAVVAKLTELSREVQERRVDALLALGQNDRALSEVAALIQESPFRERLRGQQMLAQYRNGRHEEALSTYQRARSVLLDELGLEPGPELRDLQTRILSQDPQLLGPARPSRVTVPTNGSGSSPAVAIDRTVPTPPVRLPGRADRLIGRSLELARLSELIQTRRLVTVTGTAGCGKTRLSIEVAAAAANAFPDGVWFIDLASVTEPDLVVDVIVSTIGFAGGLPEAPLEALGSYLQHRAILLILDNCEHVLSAVAATIAAILSTDSHSALLTTSREPIGMPGEVLWSLSPLAVTAGPDSTSRDAASPAPAVELFLERLAGIDPTLVLDSDELATITGICDAVDGLPLAIELAAARTRSATLTEIADQIEADLGSLRRVGRGPSDHRQSLRSAIEWSYRLLSAEEQAVHRRLSVLPGAFTRSAAAAVASGPPIESTEVPDLLAQLVHRSLLSPSRTGRRSGPTLYRQLATVRSHAARELDAIGEKYASEQRRDDWVEQLLSQRPPLSRTGAAWYDRVEDAYPTVRATLQHRLVDQPHPIGGWLLGRLSMFWYFRNRTVEAERWYQVGLQLPGVAPTDLFLMHLTVLGQAVLHGRLRSVDPRLASTLAMVTDLPDDDLVDVGELMAINALAAEAMQAPDVFAARITALATVCDRTADPGLQLLLTRLAELTAPHPAIVTDDYIDTCYRQAIDDGNVLAAWIAATLGSATATDPHSAIIWTDRQSHCQVSLGAADAGILAERRAGFMLAAGDARDATRLYAAASLYNRRAGMPWPFMPDTAAHLDQALTILGDRAFDEAWRDGSGQAVTDLMPDR